MPTSSVAPSPECCQVLSNHAPGGPAENPAQTSDIRRRRSSLRHSSYARVRPAPRRPEHRRRAAGCGRWRPRSPARSSGWPACPDGPTGCATSRCCRPGRRSPSRGPGGPRRTSSPRSPPAGITAPWRHQAMAADAAHAGRHVVLSTGTASGKSLAYQLPALTAIRTGRGPRAQRGAGVLYLAPTKALAQDQLASLQALGLDVRVTTHDGDSSREQRDWSRDFGEYVLTNPDMLHRSMLPGHRAVGAVLGDPPVRRRRRVPPLPRASSGRTSPRSCAGCGGSPRCTAPHPPSCSPPRPWPSPR